MQKIKARNLVWFVVALMAISLSACLKSSDPQPQPAQAYISVMQLATMPPAPALDVYFNDKKVSSNSFAGGAVSTLYSAVEKGVFSVSFKKGGGDSLVADIPLDQYDSLGFYTFLVYNMPDGKINAMRIEDDFSDLSLDKPYVRFFHASPSLSNLGPVDIYIDNTKAFTQRLLADNEFSGYNNQFQASTAGYHKVEVRLSSNDSLVAKASTDINLLNGNAYTIYLTGNVNGTGANAPNVYALRAAN